MYEIINNSEIEIEIKKSRFIGYSYKVQDWEETKSIIDQVRQQHKKATHVVFGVVLKTPFTERFDDDGEPSKTAGFPVLDIIKKLDYTNTLVIVVRYYGGIKLGAGGLIRAYSNCAKNTLEESGKTKKITYKKHMLKVAYDEFDILKAYLNANSITYEAVDYSSTITLKVVVEEDKESEFLAKYEKNIINE